MKHKLLFITFLFLLSCNRVKDLGPTGSWIYVFSSTHYDEIIHERSEYQIGERPRLMYVNRRLYTYRWYDMKDFNDLKAYFNKYEDTVEVMVLRAGKGKHLDIE